MNIAFIPIDNRPVCYTLPIQICAMNGDINLFMPKREFLGGLTKYADVDNIFKWLETLQDIDAFVIRYNCLWRFDFFSQNARYF